MMWRRWKSRRSSHVDQVRRSFGRVNGEKLDVEAVRTRGAPLGEMPTHAHLYLVGGVLMFLAGLFYNGHPQLSRRM
ncbi:MAG TPA: hypothetical protein VL132_21260, partial [Planctomycetaceae bacterium]|nr:hypothetical protein [Planctomycetaceae bacterium]